MMQKKPRATVQLVHISGPLEGKTQHFSIYPVNIGRHSLCHVRFENNLTTVSRRHAHIDCQEDRFRIIDTSTNGTFVNGKRIADVYLRDGDEITFSPQGPKASFLIQTELPTHLPTSSPVAQPDVDESDITIGPGMEIPVLSTATPLLVRFGESLQVFDLLPVTVGTDSTCDCVLSIDTIADRHMQIFFNQEDFYIKDLTGKKMVTINGRPVGTQSVLARGATVSLSPQGPIFRFIGGGKLVEIKDMSSELLNETIADPGLYKSSAGVPIAGRRGKNGDKEE